MKAQKRRNKSKLHSLPHKIITYTKINFKIKIKLNKICELNFICTLDGGEFSVSGSDHFIEGKEYKRQDNSESGVRHGGNVTTPSLASKGTAGVGSVAAHLTDLSSSF
jgi:hypothetical protein